MNSKQIILESSLQVFFYELLQEVNRKSNCPLSNETIFYSSLVMDKYGDSNQFFEMYEGKIREKILGLKLLESNSLPKEKMKTNIKDVAETSLLICGFFSDSLNRKILDIKYYQEIGMLAYSKLNAMEPKAYNIDSFYKNVSRKFHEITNLMTIASLNMPNEKNGNYLYISKLA